MEGSGVQAVGSEAVQRGSLVWRGVPRGEGGGPYSGGGFLGVLMGAVGSLGVGQNPLGGPWSVRGSLG